MSRRGAALVLAVGLSTASALAAAAAPAARADAGPVASAADSQAWLDRINQAASAHNYRGTMVFTAQGGVVSSSKVAHMCVGDQVYERVEALDGHLHRIYRHNEQVHTVWPQRRVVVVEPDAVGPGLVSTRRRVEASALAHYSLQVKDSHHVAGRPARLLWLQPRDALRFAHQLWVDVASGLLLRADVIAPDGRVLESSAFTEVEVGSKLDPQQMLDGMAPAGYQKLSSRREAVDWAAQGWRLRHEVTGFRLLGCVRRPALTAVADAQALQAVFSDGLSYVSIFIEPYREQQHPRALSAAMGATHTVMQRLGEHWVTAMGDVPRRTLEQFISQLERRR